MASRRSGTCCVAPLPRLPPRRGGPTPAPVGGVRPCVSALGGARIPTPPPSLPKCKKRHLERERELPASAPAPCCQTPEFPQRAKLRGFRFRSFYRLPFVRPQRQSSSSRAASRRGQMCTSFGDTCPERMRRTHVLSECEGGALGGVSLYNRISAFSILFIL
jgi:hypothetical protein